MTSPTEPNGFHGTDEPELEGARLSVGRSSAKTLQHQIAEVHRLVDDAMENLEQVVRALRYIERDL